jgi:ornithine cyclodeaminase/alanine dehydrogenase
MAQRYGMEIIAAERAESAIDGADIVLTATGTRGGQEALRGEWLQPGQHVNSIGSTAPEQREIHPSVWRTADCIALDTQRLLHESGDAIVARDAGAIDHAKVRELNQVVAGTASGRTEAQQITLYKSVGTGLQDVAAAYRIYQTARERNLGSDVAEWSSPRMMAMRAPVATT